MQVFKEQHFLLEYHARVKYARAHSTSHACKPDLRYRTNACMDLPRRCVAFGVEPAESCVEQRAHSAHADGGGNHRAHAIRQEDAVAQLPASHGSWVPRSGCKCVGSGTWHVQPESFACAGHVRIARYCACLRFGVQGAGVGSVDGLDLDARGRAHLDNRCATEYVKYAHESSVNKYKSARIQTQDTAQKCSCCFPTHVCLMSLHQ